MGIESIRDIPDDFPLDERQRRACSAKLQQSDFRFCARLIFLRETADIACLGLVYT
ncbi:MAG: hypothetical protein ABR861_08245 [Terriglobales bacterium]|jgi:hypothetical protein